MNVQAFDIEQRRGLDTKTAVERLSEVGPNKLPEPQSAGAVEIFARQFLSPFIYILVVAAIVSLAVGQLPSAIFILAVLILNASIGTVQEFSAEKSAAALRNLVKGTAHVVRDGEVQKIDSENVVRGDLIVLASGDRVPADLELIGDVGAFASFLAHDGAKSVTGGVHYIDGGVNIMA